MCRINIIHFSHHFSHPEAPNSSQVTSCNCNLFSNPAVATKLNLPRLTEDELMSQRQPQHQFVLCPTHVNSCCVVYKQTTPCLLQKFHSAGWQDAASAAAAADVNGDGDLNGDWEGGVGGGGELGGVNGVDVTGCPNLVVTGEYHPLSMIIGNENENGESVVPQRFQSLSQASTAILTTADEIHTQKVIIDKHLLEASELLERLFRDLAHARATLQHHLPAQRGAFFREFERPLNQCAELCKKIREADGRICGLFKDFLQKHKGMSDLLIDVEKKYTLQGGVNSDAYPISKARQDLTVLSTSNVREVCEGPLRRGRELSAELVQLLEAVSNFMQPVQPGQA